MSWPFFLLPFQAISISNLWFSNHSLTLTQINKSMISSREWDNQHHQHLSDKNPIPFTATFSACLANHWFLSSPKSKVQRWITIPQNKYKRNSSSSLMTTIIMSRTKKFTSVTELFSESKGKEWKGKENFYKNQHHPLLLQFSK